MNANCCMNEWSQTCANLAAAHCPDLPGCGASAGSCCIANTTPGCDDADCVALICASDPFCCNTAWDGICAGAAAEYCPQACGGCGLSDAGPCCAANDSPGCDDAPCCQTVCDLNPDCCGDGGEWTLECVVLAVANCDGHCGACGEVSSGSCCAPNGTAYCSDGACCNLVCNEDPYCCEIVWDGCCAKLAVEHCSNLPSCRPSLPPDPPQFQPVGPPPSTCGLPDAGDCFDPDGTGSPGCDDLDCCVSVCATDPFCCDVVWDAFCYDVPPDVKCLLGPGQCGATGQCSPGPPPAFSCKDNCGGAAAGGCWCDESCCDFGDCCIDKAYKCLGCTPDDPGAMPISQYSTCQGACSDQPGTGGGGCSCDEGCCERGDCCPDKAEHCGGCAPPLFNPADLTGNNRVNVHDLLQLLDNWGACEFERCFVLEECPGDFNHDHTVDVLDLLYLLENWG